MPTSVFPCSLQWPLEMCEGNWSVAEAKLSIVQALIDKKVDFSYGPSLWALSHSHWQAYPSRGTPRARQRCLSGQSQCSLPEAVQLPTVSDVCFSFQPSDLQSMWMGASLDFKAAHKQVKIREQTQACFSSSSLESFAATWYAALEPASQPTGGSVLKPCCCASRASCLPSSLTEPDFT